jgi:hypothetical protein
MSGNGSSWSTWSRGTKIFVSVGVALAAVFVVVMNFG